MGKSELIDFAAKAAYDAICERASRMARERPLPKLGEMERLCLEAGIAAGVTAAIQTFNEAGLLA